jgi:hypothetical protein
VLLKWIDSKASIVSMVLLYVNSMICSKALICFFGFKFLTTTMRSSEDCNRAWNIDQQRYFLLCIFWLLTYLWVVDRTPVWIDCIWSTGFTYFMCTNGHIGKNGHKFILT